jgi:hypothetical protein
MVSMGDWRYTKDFTTAIFDDNQQQIGEGTLYLKGAKVGNAAQFTSYFAADYKLGKKFNIDLGYRFVDGLYADYAITDAVFTQPDNLGALKLPSYGLADLGLTERDLFIELSLLHQEKPEIWGKPEISWDQDIIVELKVSELPALPEFHYDDDSYEIYEDTVRLIINKHGRLSIIGLYKNPYISIEDLKSPNFELGPLDLFEAIWKYDGPIKITGSDSLMKAIHSFNSAKGLGDPFGVVTDEWSHD